jgi:hypothetical protein
MAPRELVYGPRLNGSTAEHHHDSEKSTMKFTSTIVLGAFAALSLIAVPACDDKKEDKKADDKKGDAKKDEKKADDKKADAKTDEVKEDVKEDAKADEGGADAAAEGGDAGDAAAGDKIGVPECDEYIDNYMKCIDEKLPDAVKETSKKALETSREAWKKAAATPAGKEGLAQACKTAADAVKASCGW